MRRRLISILVIVTLLAGMMIGGQVASAGAAGAYDEISLNDFGIGAFTEIHNNRQTWTKDADKSLNGTAIIGYYYLSPQNSLLYFGGQWDGFKLQSISEEELNVSFWEENGTVPKYLDANSQWNITKQEAGVDLAGRVMKLKVAFQVADVTATRSTLHATVTIDDSFSKTFTYNDVLLEDVRQVVMAYSLAENSPMFLNLASAQENPFGYTEQVIGDYGFGGNTELENQYVSEAKNANAPLSGTAITGYYHLSPQNNILYFGGAYDGLKIQSISENEWNVVYMKDNGATQLLDATNQYNITKDEAGVTLAGRTVKLRVAFRTSDITQETITVQAIITIDDTFTKTFTYLNVPEQTARQVVSAWSTAKNNPMRLNLASAQDDPTSIDEQTLDQYGFAEASKLVNEYVVKTKDANKTLDGVAITDYYYFSPQENILYFGGEYDGLKIQSISENELNVVFMTNGGNTQLIDTSGLYNITKDEAGMTLAGRVIKMRTEFRLSDIKATTADVKAIITIDDTFTKTFVYQDVLLEDAKQVIMAWARNTGNPMFLNLESAQDNPLDYEDQTLADYDFETSTELYNKYVVKVKDAEKSLHGKTITGYYYLSPQENIIYFGGEYDGLKLQSISENELNVVFMINNGNTQLIDVNGQYNITKDEAGITLAGRVIKLQTQFRLSDITAATADVKATITIDDTFTKTFTYQDVLLEDAKQVIMAWSRNIDSPMFVNLESAQSNPLDYESQTLGGYGFGSYTVLDNQSLTKEKDAEKTLDGVEIVGKYHFSPKRNIVCFGGYWSGVRIQSVDNDKLEIVFSANQGQNVMYDTAVILTPEEVGTALVGCDLEIGMRFDVINATDDTADLKLKMTIADSYVRTILYKNVPLSDVKQVMFAYADLDCPMVLNIGEGQFNKPTLAPITMNETGIENGKYVAGTNAVGKHPEALINTALTQRVVFSKHANLVMNYAGATNENEGISFRTQADGSILIVAANGEFTETYTLTPDIAGKDLLGKEIKLSLQLFESGADMFLGVYIDGVAYNYQYFKLTGAKGKLGNNIGLFVGDESGSITLLGAMSIDSNYTQLTFDSYDVDSGVYGYNGTPDLIIDEKCDLDSMDGVVLRDTLNFTDKPGAQMYIGGKDHGWQGLLLASLGEGALTIIDVAGGNNPAIRFDSAIAGVQLTDNDVEMAFSFSYVDADNDGEKDDVKLGVWFDGKAYNDEWFYLYNIAPNLGGHLGVYSAAEGSSIGITTYTPPIDFAEWGFTKDWAKTLGLV